MVYSLSGLKPSVIIALRGIAPIMSAPQFARTFFWESPCRLGEEGASKRDRNIRLGVLCAFILVNLIFILTHEPWQDEAQAWLLVRDLDLPSIFGALKSEGHPALWYLILFPFAKLGFPIVTMRFISLAAVSVAAWLLLAKSPLPPAFQILLLASPLFTYYLPAISRSYSIALLLIVAACVLYRERLKRPLALGVVIALLFQTHVILAGFALGLAILMIVDAVKEPEARSHLLVGSLIGICGLVATYLELRGGPSSGTTFGSIVASILDDPMTTGFLFSQHYQLNIGVFTYTAGPASALLYALSLIAVILPVILDARRYWRPFFLALFGIGAQLVISVYFYSTGNYRSLFFWAMLLVAGWLIFETANEGRMRGSGRKGSTCPEGSATDIADNAHGSENRMRQGAAYTIARGGILAMITAFFLVTIVPTWSDAVHDVVHPYSGCIDMADYINSELEPGTVIVSGCGSSASSIVPFTPTMVHWNPGVYRTYSYCDWGLTWSNVMAWDQYLGVRPVIEHYLLWYPDATSIYIIANNYTPFPAEYDSYIVHSQEDVILDLENFRLYRFPIPFDDYAS